MNTATEVQADPRVKVHAHLIDMIILLRNVGLEPPEELVSAALALARLHAQQVIEAYDLPKQLPPITPPQ